ncbi:MAG: hypothetical protein ACM3O7_11225 [Acidobacteriota bacterium]
MTATEAARRLLASPLLRRLSSAWEGGRLYLTGGSLRDRLLGLPTHDLDIVAEGDPASAARALAAVFGGRSFPLGRAPAVTWRIVADGLQLDVVAIDTNVETDIMRRDFTINALFWRLPRGPLLDLVGGLDDLAAGRIRVVREANLRSDPLRVLRAFRLAASRPQLRLTAEGEAQLSAAARGLSSVASERVVEELRLLLAAPGVERALLGAARCQVLTALLPGWQSADASREAASVAARLARGAAGRGALARGATEIAPAVLGAPAAGFPSRWDPAAAADALAAVGWPLRQRQRAVAAAGLGERLARCVDDDRFASRAIAAEAGTLLPAALAWSLARRQEHDPDPARALLRWWRRFDEAPPLLSGDEIAELCRLPEGPARSEAVRALRLARARGEVRTREQARRWLLSGG